MRDASAALSGLKGEAPRPHFCGDGLVSSVYAAMSSLDTEVVGGTAAEADGDKSTKSEPQALFQATFKLGEVNSRTQKHNRRQSAYRRIRGEDGPGGKRHRWVPNEPTHAHSTQLSAHRKSRYSTRSVSLVHWAVCRRRTARARRAAVFCRAVP
jgi:hypothetical protein